MTRRESDTSRLDLEIVRLGKILVHHFFILLKTTANYSRRHPATIASAKALSGTIVEIQRRREEASLSIMEGHLFCGETLLKPDAAGFEAFLYIVRSMKKLSLGVYLISSRSPHRRARRNGASLR